MKKLSHELIMQLQQIASVPYELIERYQGVLAREQAHVVAYGSYNQGKSSLLNALTDTQDFKVGDVPTTVTVQQLASKGVIWFDTPGLNADFKKTEDRLSQQAAIAEADLLLFCHRAQAGELDASELDQIRELAQHHPDLATRSMLVITGIDEVSQDELLSISQKVQKQLEQQALTMLVQGCSVNRYQSPHRRLRGLSNIERVRQAIQQHLAQVQTARTRQTSALYQEIRQRVESSCQAQQQALRQAQARSQQRKTQWREAFASLL